MNRKEEEEEIQSSKCIPLSKKGETERQKPSAT